MSLYNVYDPSQVIRLGPKPKRERVCIGLDVGSRVDYSAMALMRLEGTGQDDYHLDCFGLHRWPLNTPLKVISDEVLEAHMASPPGAFLLIDRIGIGQMVSETVAREAEKRGRVGGVWGIAWHGGDSTREIRPRDINLPKAEVVAKLQWLLEWDRLSLPKNSPLADQLRTELLNYTRKVTPQGREQYEGRGEHDDLLASVALAMIGLTNEQFVIPLLHAWAQGDALSDEGIDTVEVG